MGMMRVMTIVMIIMLICAVFLVIYLCLKKRRVFENSKRLESGNMEIGQADYMLSSLVCDVVSVFRMKTACTRIRFAVQLDSNLPNALTGDEKKAREILISILDNAVKHAELGHVIFSISGEVVSKDTVKLVFVVEDSGLGVKSEDIEKMFGDYGDHVKDDAKKNADFEGAGQGLAITRSLTEEIGGKITVESEYGKGRKLIVTLPQKIANPERLAAVKEPESMRALVYERRKVYADSVVYTIRNLGVVCDLVTGDREFFSLLRTGAYTHIFGSSELIVRNTKSIMLYGDSFDVTLITEFGETVHSDVWQVLPMPIHAISVANVFNGISCHDTLKTGKGHMTGILLPESDTLLSDEGESKHGIEIEGVDEDKGIRISGGTKEAYLDMLASFMEDGFDRIGMIRKCLETDNIPLYAVYIQALKSALANIGADDLAETAATLEAAAQKRNRVYIESINEQFLAVLMRLLRNIKATLAES